MKIPLIGYIFVFFLFSFLGWIFENILVKEPSYDNFSKHLGIQCMPMLWIYGLGAVLILALYVYIPGPLIVKILLATIIVNIMECLCGQLSKIVYGRQTWSYASWRIPMCGGYISIITAIFWSILIAIAYIILSKTINNRIKLYYS